MEKKIKIKITSLSTDNPVNVIKGEGTYREQGGKVLITHTDDDSNKTSMIITKERIMLIRRSPLYTLKIPVIKGKKLSGIMGEESIFTVIGKEAEFERNNKEGRAYIEYTLPDLSEKSTNFKIEAEFEFLK